MILTVIIRDETPMRYLNEPVSLRTIHVKLTAEQKQALRLRSENEAISHAFIESAQEGAGE